MPPHHASPCKKTTMFEHWFVFCLYVRVSLYVYVRLHGQSATVSALVLYYMLVRQGCGWPQVQNPVAGGGCHPAQRNVSASGAGKGSTS